MSPRTTPVHSHSQLPSKIVGFWELRVVMIYDAFGWIAENVVNDAVKASESFFFTEHEALADGEQWCNLNKYSK